MNLLAFLCFVLAAILFFLFAVKVDLGTALRWDWLGFFFIALGLALGCLPALGNIHWPVVRQPNP